MDQILLIFLAFVLGIIGGFIVQFTSNPIQKRYEAWKNEQEKKQSRKSVTKAKARIAAIESELVELKQLADNPIEVQIITYLEIKRWLTSIIKIVVTIFMFQAMLQFLYSRSNLITVLIPDLKYEFAFFTLNLVFMVYILILPMPLTTKGSTVLKNIRNLEKYEEEMQDQIADLRNVIFDFSEGDPAQHH